MSSCHHPTDSNNNKRRRPASSSPTLVVAKEEEVVVKCSNKYFKPIMEYSGYKLDDDNSCSMIMSSSSISSSSSSSPALDFFDQYVNARKPCIIPKQSSAFVKEDSIIFNLQLHDLESLVEDDDDDKIELQVEERASTEQEFGQNRTNDRQKIMLLKDFISELKGGNQHLYLSTQQQLSDDDDSCLFHINSPCKELMNMKKIPFQPEISGNLILESCNLWMGHSKNGSSSGLHHDHHDNLYFLIKGKKDFVLYSPDNATYMYTYGAIDRVYPNGRISYVGSQCYADGRPLLLENESSGHEEEEEEEFVIGKGYDYESSSDEEGNAIHGFDEQGAADDFEVLVKEEEENDQYRSLASCKSETMIPDETNHSRSFLISSESQRPDNFSQTSSTLSHEALKSRFPLFEENVKKVRVTLNAGDALYLPAGWFHEVTSYDDDDSSTAEKYHMAINYWFHPPDSHSFNCPYQSKYWNEERQRISKAREQLLQDKKYRIHCFRLFLML